MNYKLTALNIVFEAKNNASPSRTAVGVNHPDPQGPLAVRALQR